MRDAWQIRCGGSFADNVRESVRESDVTVTQKIDIPHDSDSSKEVRPTFFNEPPVMYTGGDVP